MDFETMAMRFNEDKPELSQILFFGSALEKLAMVMSQGRIKYPDSTPGVPNWTLGGKPDSEYLDAAMRHFVKLVNGEFYDQDLGVSHAGQIVWNILAYLENNHADMPALDPDFDQDEYIRICRERLEALTAEPIGDEDIPAEDVVFAEGDRVQWVVGINKGTVLEVTTPNVIRVSWDTGVTMNEHPMNLRHV